MTELSHDQAHHLLQTATDGGLNAEGRAALRAHMDACPKCRNYAAEFNWVHRALYRAWRARWHTRRSLADMSSRVLAAARREFQRKLFFSFAHAFARVGTLVVVGVFVVGLLQSQMFSLNNTTGNTANINSAANSRYESSLPTFEMESDGSQLIPSNMSSEEEWPGPGFIDRTTNAPILQ
ncbi:MAG: zf-HC2 domain-containing protein [Chloroflexi bacterium]|nr:zf-HC2 domain-containing protein [Chloroflexota bacterium]